MSLAEIHNLLSGPAGFEPERLGGARPPAEPQKIVITRDIVTVPPVADKMVDDGIGDIQVDAFTKGKAQEIAAKVKALQKAGAKKLILDLRNCAEGDESEGIATANLFLNHGTITYLQGQKYPREAFNADPSKAITNLPLVGAGEQRNGRSRLKIVAAAILENARGDVVGDKTFGDGSVQKLIELPRWFGADLVGRQVLLAQRQGDSGLRGNPERCGCRTTTMKRLPDDDENATPPDARGKEAASADRRAICR